jgi:hypothetical protein
VGGRGKRSLLVFSLDSVASQSVRSQRLDGRKFFLFKLIADRIDWADCEQVAMLPASVGPLGCCSVLVILESYVRF